MRAGPRRIGLQVLSGAVYVGQPLGGCRLRVVDSEHGSEVVEEDICVDDTEYGESSTSALEPVILERT